MTQITNFGTLKTALIAEMNRTDLTTHLPGFVQRAEQEFNRTLRHPKMIFVDTSYSLLAGLYTGLPTELIEPITLATNDAGGWVQWKYDGSVGAFFRRGSVSDANSQHFYIEGTSLAASPPLSAGKFATFTYYRYIPTILTNDATYNWLLTDHSGLYLYRSLMEAATHMRDSDRLQSYGAAYQGALDAFQRAGRKYRSVVGMQVRLG